MGPLYGSPWGRGGGSAAGSQLWLKAIPCPMGGRGLISELDGVQVLRTQAAKQLPESPMSTAPPQPQSFKKRVEASESASIRGSPVPTPVTASGFQIQDREMKAASSLILRFSENLDLGRYVQAYFHPFPSFYPFLLRNSQGQGFCQDESVGG